MKLNKFILSQEGKIFFVGILSLFGYFMNIIYGYNHSVDDSHNLIGMTIANFFFGRAAGISYGFAVGLSDSYIILINIIIELIIVMIIYPIFVLSWKKSLDIDFLKSYIIKMEDQKSKYKDFFEKYGKYGLFIFVWFPFWMTGPIVGSIIGFLIGIKHYTTMTIVLSGTSVAIVIWTYFLKELITLLNQLNSSSAYIVVGLFIIIAIVLKVKKSKTK